MTTINDDNMPKDGWWPDEESATVSQWLLHKGLRVAQVIRQSLSGWRAFSMVQLNKSGTSGMPLGPTVSTRDEARATCEEYLTTLNENRPHFWHKMLHEIGEEAKEFGDATGEAIGDHFFDR
jgi:hypothetical protein